MLFRFDILKTDTFSVQWFSRKWQSWMKLSHGMRFPTMWYLRPAKPQISLHIRAVISEPLLVACIFYDSLTTDWTTFGDSKLKRRLHRLVWVYTCQNTTLLEITWHGSNYFVSDSLKMFNYLPPTVVCWQHLQAVWNQIGPGLIWIQTVWHSDGIPERHFSEKLI